MSYSEIELLNPKVNSEKRIATLEYVQIRHKTRKIQCQTFPQVGLFARLDLEHLIPRGCIILEEDPLVMFQYVEWLQDPGTCEEDSDINTVELVLQHLPSEKKSKYTLLYCSPELVRETGCDNLDLLRWETNRFRFERSCEESHHTKADTKVKCVKIVEAIYEHSSAIDHSCLNWNAQAVLKHGDPDLTLQIIAREDIKPGEEILIHYDWEKWHDPCSGVRNGEALPDTVHSGLFVDRGFFCEDCIFERCNKNSPHNRQKSAIALEQRPILKPSSKIMEFKKKELEREKGKSSK